MDGEEKTDIPDKGLTINEEKISYESNNNSNYNKSITNSFSNSNSLNEENDNFKLKSDLLESDFIENKENLLKSLVASDVNFVSELSQPSEMQVKRFIQNVEEGMKEYAILQEEDHSLSMSNERLEIIKSNESNNIIKEMVNSPNKNELEGLLNSSDFRDFDSKVSLKEENKDIDQIKNQESNLEIKDIIKRDTKITLTESGIVNYKIPNLGEEEKEENDGFMFEHGAPKKAENFKPESYQTSERNNKLMSELLEHDSFKNSSNYLSIKSNGIELKNSGLMMDLGIYEMYKKSNLITGLKDEPEEEENLMSAIQMKDSDVNNNDFFIDPKNSLDKLKAKILNNGNLVDSSLFSKREIDNSKRKSLNVKLETQSSKNIKNINPEKIDPLISEIDIKNHESINKDSSNPHVYKFAKSNWNNTLRDIKFEEVDNEGDIYISNTNPEDNSDNMHMIVDTIIPDLGINFMQNNLQDSLTNYEESHKEMIDNNQDQFMEDNYYSEFSDNMTVEEEINIEKQNREINEFEKLMDSKLSNFEEQEKLFLKTSKKEENNNNNNNNEN